ncbi:hypothetical protein [Segatella copri]|uniref:hypothetical protein n=1 Tax=Segatella copri TaxID=165179 RepID=UPI00294B022C|nr:hypothetical protein [Segatella copri]
MEVTITLIICLSMVFIITLGIISYTLRDENFKARFDKSNERLKRIIKEQHDELISYREAIKKNDANLKESLKVLASASDVIKTRMSRLKDTEETLSMLKLEVGDLNLNQDKFLKMIEKTSKNFSENTVSFYASVDKYRAQNEVALKGLENKILSRTSYLSVEEKKRFKEYLQACAFKFHDINNMKYKNDYTFVKVYDVIRALDIVGYDQWDSILETTPSEEFANGQNTERNQ